MQQVKFDEINKFEKNVWLVFSKTTGKFVGFCEMGEINEEIEKLRAMGSL